MEVYRLLGSDQRHVTEVKTEGGTLTDQKRIIDEFSRYFSSLAGGCGDVFSFKRVEEEEVMRLLGALDVNKAVGVDAIRNCYGWQLLASVQALHHCSITAFSVDKFLEWKSANV